MQRHYSRRRVLQSLGLGVAAAGTLGFAWEEREEAIAQSAVSTSLKSIKHILISCEENHSFDNYFGTYTPTSSGQSVYGIPAGWSQPDGKGGVVRPFHLTSFQFPDIGHTWEDIHSEWNGGGMNGFYTTDGITAMGYYTQQDLPFYYQMAKQYTLCGNYFCSALGPSEPNHLYRVSATCGGYTTNNVPFGTLDWPMILDLLDKHHITFKNYVISPRTKDRGTDSPLTWWKNWANDSRLYQTEADYNNDLRKGTLPQVCFFNNPSDNEHPGPTDNVQAAQDSHKKIIQALMASKAWNSSVFVLTYDEAGGFFDHVVPPVLDAYGAGIRVPTLVISPLAKRGHVESTRYEHCSLLKFIEKVFKLPTLASINHQFDAATPDLDGNNEATNGPGKSPEPRPAAPPRDGRTDIGDMSECLLGIPSGI